MTKNNHVVIRVPIPREMHENLHKHCSHAGLKRNALILRLIENYMNKQTTHTDQTIVIE